MKQREGESERGGREGGKQSETKCRCGSTCLRGQNQPLPPSEIQISKIMQELTQFAGSRQIHRGCGQNTDGRQALEGPALAATFPLFCPRAKENELKSSPVQ